MARGAPLTVLDDETALNGPDLDVAVRIGWIARMARLTPGRAATLDELARRTGASPARLHRLETGRIRDGALVDAYEVALDRPQGSLRAPVDVMCRTFPSSPTDRDPSSGLTTVGEVSAATERVSAPSPSGGNWLAWARALSAPGAVGMPESLAVQLLTRLVSELNRSTGHGYPSRYEALALMRCGGYGHLVVQVAQACLADPHVQVLYDLMSAVGESVTPDAVDWCLELLDDPRERVMIGGALALENMGQISGDLAFWNPLAGPVAELFNASDAGSVRWEWLSHLLRLMPRASRSRGRVELRQELAPSARIDNWSRTRLNAHWTACEDSAQAVTRDLGMADQPVLARLLFDIAISPHETRAVTSYMLISAVPHLSLPLGRSVAEIAEQHPDPVIRRRAGRRLPGALHGAFPDIASRWLTGDSVEQRDQALLLAGAAGRDVPDGLLRRAIADGGGSVTAALYAAGMAGHPILGELSAGPPRKRDPQVTGAAQWWLRAGGRVTDG